MMRNNVSRLHSSIPQVKRAVMSLSVLFASVTLSMSAMAELKFQQGSYDSNASIAWSDADVGMLLDNDMPVGEVSVQVSRSDAASNTSQQPILLNNSTIESRYPSSSYSTNRSPMTGNNYASSANYSNSYNQPSVNARAALVVDAHTGEVLFSKNTSTVLPIASITKLMTAVVIADARLDMSERITLQSIDFAGAGGKNSSSTLRAGDTLNRAEALLFALMKSENPAAAALARTYPGGRVAFVAAMNSKAKELGMYSSRFTESTGLDPRNVASAHDLGILVSSASQYGLIRQFSTTPNYNFNLGQRVLSSNNTNALVRNGGWNIGLSKTGYINEAGRCVVMHTTLNNRAVAVVLLGASTSVARTNDAMRLMGWVGQLPKRL